jgi:hypothetical protein
MENTILITITGTWVSSHYSNWIECETTWVPKMREKGFKVIYLMSNPHLDKNYELVGNFFFAKCPDTLESIYYKNHYHISKYLLKETNYQYRFHVDSDTFVHPDRVIDIFKEYTIVNPKDYVGCVTPYPGLNTNFLNKIEINEPNYYASGGSGFLISRRSMKYMVGLFNEEEYETLADCDKITGEILYKEGIRLWHDSRFLFESPYKLIIDNSENLPNPFVGDPNSFLAVQHYCNGHMKEIMELLNL